MVLTIENGDMSITDPTTTDVLIAGAGPTGLTLAVDLARRGVRARIVDSAASHFVGSRGKGLQERSLEVLADLGVADQLRTAGWALPVRVSTRGRPVRVASSQSLRAKPPADSQEGRHRILPNAIGLGSAGVHRFRMCLRPHTWREQEERLRSLSSKRRLDPEEFG